MGILTREVEIKPTGKMIQYYKDKGYDAKWRKPLLVNVDDLSKGSNVEIEILCDFCKENKMMVPYYKYNETVEKTGSYTCKDCWSKKRMQTNLSRYGVDNYAKTQEYLEKIKDTMKVRYGVEHNSQLPDYREKYDKTCKERYGEFYSKYFTSKAHHTFYERTGYDSPFKSPKIREGITQHWVEKYGVSNPVQSPEVRAKVNETLCKNGAQKTSKQQLYLHYLFGGELNFAIKYYAIDICFPEEKIALEYDGKGHDLRVTLGHMTQEEFDRKELTRDKVIKSEGYKIIRVKSLTDKLPSDQILLQMLQDARTYFSQYPNHSWIEFSIDTSTIRNAENPNGLLYDFGTLRTIKDSDLSPDLSLDTSAIA